MNRKLTFSGFVFLFLMILSWSNCGEEKIIHLNEFPKEKFEKVMAYRMIGEEGEVIENNRLSHQVIGKGELLNTEEEKELISIFSTPSSYGGVAAKCFSPHVGYVFYGKEDKIIGHTTICLSCNWMKSTPYIGAFVFSKTGQKRLSKIEKNIFEQ